VTLLETFSVGSRLPTSPPVSATTSVPPYLLVRADAGASATSPRHDDRGDDTKVGAAIAGAGSHLARILRPTLPSSLFIRSDPGYRNRSSSNGPHGGYDRARAALTHRGTKRGGRTTVPMGLAEVVGREAGSEAFPRHGHEL